MYMKALLNVIGVFLILLKAYGNPVKTEVLVIEKKPYENPKLVEGDMLFPKTSGLAGRGVALRGASVRWTDGIIPYEILPGYKPTEQSFIVGTMQKMERLIAINNYKCIQFRERVSTDPYYISITNGVGCSSYVGQNTDVNMNRTVSLEHPGCIREGIIMHELLHALGFYHEQSRPDRDDYVRVNYTNIQSEMQFNFDKYNNTVVDTQNTSYDLLSVMHYDSTTFSVNGLPTIEPLVPNGRMGQRDNMSATDILEVRLFYNCTTTGVTLPPTPATTRVIFNVQTTIASSWTTNSQTFARDGYSKSRYYYERYQIIVLQTGSYIFTCNSSLDTYGYFYSSAFSASSPHLNLLAVDDDSAGDGQFKMQVDLQGNVPYELVATTFNSSVTGSYTLMVFGLNSVSIRKIGEPPVTNTIVGMTTSVAYKLRASLLLLTVGGFIRNIC